MPTSVHICAFFFSHYFVICAGNRFAAVHQPGRGHHHQRCAGRGGAARGHQAGGRRRARAKAEDPAADGGRGARPLRRHRVRLPAARLPPSVRLDRNRPLRPPEGLHRTNRVAAHHHAAGAVAAPAATAPGPTRWPS